MFKGLMMIGVIVISVLLLVGTEANAGCIPLGGGGLFCADWLTGSEICAVLFATTEAISKGKTTTPNCGVDECEVTCKVSGTVKEPTLKDSKEKTSKSKGKDAGEPSCKPGSDDCGIRGFAFCEASTYPSSYHDKEKDEDEKPSIVRNSLILTQDNTSDLPIMETKEINDQNCKEKQNGGSICLKSIELDPHHCHDCCPKNYDFITFTAQEFLAEVKVCPGKYGSGECVRLVERCKMDPDAIKFGKSSLYTCKPL